MAGLSALGTAATGVISGGIKKTAATAIANPGNLMTGAHFLSNINSNMASGRSLGGAVAKTAVTSALYGTNPGLMTAISLTQMGVQGVHAAHQYRRKRAEEFLHIGNQSQRVGGGYMDTSQAQTMRQAALQQIQGNKLNARSALGGEARIFSNRRMTG